MQVWQRDGSGTEFGANTAPTDLSVNLDHVRARIIQAAKRSGRAGDEVTLIAVTKTHPLQMMEEAYVNAVRDFGESRIQEALEKLPLLNLPGAVYHLIGHLQTNKAKHAAALFHFVHSIDSVRVARALSSQCEQLGKRMPVTLEVNVAGEQSKFGLHVDEVELAACEVASLPGIKVVGLMTVAPLVGDPEKTRGVFRRLKLLREDLRCSVPEVEWRHLSMGMTDDFEIAVEEGATMIRVGRAIFGPRRQ
jgi:PLP dependent protein